MNGRAQLTVELERLRVELRQASPDPTDPDVQERHRRIGELEPEIAKLDEEGEGDDDHAG
jgi:hypothetical protein